MNLIQGDCITELKRLDAESVQTCVTSPPYFGLRDYGVDGQLGLEPTPDAYVAKMVEVFAEVRRDDGTLWLNLGDSYVSHKPRDKSKHTSSDGFNQSPGFSAAKRAPDLRGKHGLKDKDLIGIPWRVAFALQVDGWYLRQDIIWHKPNAMPSSVKDRCTSSHEYIFLLAKSKKYYYDHDAVKEPAVSGHPSGNGFKRPESLSFQNKDGSPRGDDKQWSDVGGMRNRRSVWTVTTKPFKGAHFAVFPPDLIEPCILAGSPEGGVVLDPFMGSGTTGMVAQKHGRNFVGIELNPDYIEMARRRIES